MKNAFSMVELIFIIVLMGILAKIASSYIPDNRLLNDTNYVNMKIKEKQKNAIGYENFRFGNGKFWDENSSDFNLTCIKFDKTSLESLDKSYALTSSVKSSTTTCCFDSLGRPYSAEQLLLKNIDINVTYNNKINTISVLPMSGYVIMK